jgi:hypothetical protein
MFVISFISTHICVIVWLNEQFSKYVVMLGLPFISCYLLFPYSYVFYSFKRCSIDVDFVPGNLMRKFGGVHSTNFYKESQSCIINMVLNLFISP